MGRRRPTPPRASKCYIGKEIRRLFINLITRTAGTAGQTMH
jgi:hypothetical protein